MLKRPVEENKVTSSGMRVEIGQRIRHARHRRGIRLRTAARALGIAPDELDEIEQGIRPVTSWQLGALCDLTRLSLEELLRPVFGKP